MTPRERLLAALYRRKPDCVPVGIHNIRTYLRYMSKKLGRKIEELEALEMFGFDPVIYVHDSKKLDPSDDWRVTTETIEEKSDGKIVLHTIETPKGKLTQRVKTVSYTSWRLDPLLKEPADVEKLVYEPVAEYDAVAFRNHREELGDRGIVRSGTASPANLMIYRGDENLCRDFTDRPEWVKQTLQMLTEKTLQRIESLPAQYVDLVEFPCHIGTMISAKTYEEFFLPFDKQVVDALHQKGVPTTMHNCGKCSHQLEMMAATGTDCIETCTPPSHGGDLNLAEARKRIGNRVTLIGGYDQAFLERGTPEQVRGEVKRCLDQAGRYGGYLMWTTDHFFEAPFENLHAMVLAARDFGRCP